MALAIDSTNATGTSGTHVSSVNFAFTNTAGDLLVLVAGIGTSNPGTASFAFTYGGVAVSTAVGDKTGPGWVRNVGKAKISPLTGSNSAVITISNGAEIPDQLALGAISFSGADLVTPVGATSSGSGNTGDPSVAGFTVASGSIALCGCSNDTGNTLGPGSGMVQRWRILNVGGDTDHGMFSKAGTGASETCPLDVTGNDNWCEWAAEIVAAATATGGGASIGPVRPPNPRVGPMALRWTYRRPQYLPPGSTTVFTDSVTEAVTASESQSATAAFASAITEATAPSESQSAQVDFVAAITETVAPSETQAAAATFASAITEAVTADESSDATISQDVEITESVAPSDTVSATVDFAATIVESVTIIDASDATGGSAAGGYPFEPDSTAIPYFPHVARERDLNAQDDEQVLQVVAAVVLALF